MLTEEQIIQAREKIGMPKEGFKKTGQTSSPAESIARRRLLASEYDASQKGEGVFSKILGRAGERLKSAFTKTAGGEIHPLSGSLQTVGSGAGVIGDVIFEGIKAITPQPVKEAVKTGVETVASIPEVSNVLEKINEWSVQHPEAAANLEATLDIAGLIPPVKGTQVAGKIAKKGVEKGVELGGMARQPIGTLLEKTGGKIQGSAPIFRPNIREAGLIQSERSSRSFIENAKNYLTGKTDEIRKMSDTATDYNLAGLTESQIGIQAKTEMKNLWKNDISVALSSIKKKITPDGLFNKIESQIKGISDETRRKSLLNALDSIKDDYKKIKEWDFTELNKLKSEFNERIPNKAWKGQEIAGDLNKLRYLASTEIRKIILNEIPEKAVKYLDYGNLKTIAERGKNAMTKPWMSGGSGKVIGSILTGGVTPIQTLGGNTIKWLGKFIKGDIK